MVKEEKLSQNTLTPKLDPTMDMMEMSPHELSELYTNTHVVWNALLSGKVWDDWTFDKVKNLHKNVLSRMKEEGIRYDPISDGLDMSVNMTREHSEVQNIQPKLNNAMAKIKDMLEQDRNKEQKNKQDLIDILAKSQAENSNTIENIKKTIKDNKPQPLDEGKIVEVVVKIMEEKIKKEQEEKNNEDKDRMIKEDKKNKELKIVEDSAVEKLPSEILAEFYKTHQQLISLYKHSDSNPKKNANEIPNTEEKKDIAKLPKDIKSNIKDLLVFAKEHGCPNCAGKTIRLVGFMEHGESAKFGCVDCQTLWIINKEPEDESTHDGYATYNYEKVEMAKATWDKIYPDLLGPEKKFSDAMENEFKSMETKYLKAYDSGIKKFADKAIGQEALVLTLKGEMEEIAYGGELTVAKDLKLPVPKALNPNALAFVNTYSLELGTDIAKGVQENIRAQIAGGIAEGAGVREIRKRISSVFSKGVTVKVPAKMVGGKIVRKAYTRFVSAETRTKSIAQTETMRAFNRGRYETMKSVKGISGWKYEASADERTCAICMDLDGNEYPKDDHSKLPPNAHANCRCTFSYVFGKKLQEKPKIEEPVVVKNIKPKFNLKKNSKTETYKVEIPNLAGDKTDMFNLETSETDIETDIGWIEHGAQLSTLKEYFLHGKKIKGRWLSDNKSLKKAKDEIPYVLSGKKYIPEKGFSALPKGLMARLPRNLRWYELNLQGKEAQDIIDKASNLLFQRPMPEVKVKQKEMTVVEEINEMMSNIEPMKVENQIHKFLGSYKQHKHMMSVDAIKLRKLETWTGKTPKFKLPLQVEGIGLESGAWMGMSQEWVYYPDEVIKKSAPLLVGTQIRLDHADDGDSLDKVVGWVTKSKSAINKRGRQEIQYQGLIFDYKTAKNIFDKKIRKTSVSPYVREAVDEEKGLIAEDIKAFAEISVLSGNNPACRTATVKVS